MVGYLVLLKYFRANGRFQSNWFPVHLYVSLVITNHQSVSFDAENSAYRVLSSTKLAFTIQEILYFSFFPVFVQHCSLWCAFQVGTVDCSVFCHMASLVTVQNVMYASMVFFSRALEVWVLVRYRRGWATPHSLWNTVFALLGFARCARIGTPGGTWVQFPSRFGSVPFVMWACP